MLVRRAGPEASARAAARPRCRAAAALASSPADAYRSAGFLAMPLATTASNAGLTRGAARPWRRGEHVRAHDLPQVPRLERRPAGQALVEQARHEYTSEAGPPALPLSRSGAM